MTSQTSDGHTSPADFYRTTVFLPKTDFPMRGDLPKREPAIAQKWVDIDLYEQIRKLSKGREKFILHAGPPYANNPMHVGHALTNILKDTVNKSWQMMGYDAPMVMGWDCHGLPIEWEIEKKYRADGKDKDSVDPISFRQECRDYAHHWIQHHTRDLKRIGIVGDFKNPYLTMSFDAEAKIAEVVHRFAMNGGLYRGVKPVMWSVIEKTALADAETEYKEHKSITVWVKFPVSSSSVSLPEGTGIVIWTTTPWTLPSNRAIAFGPSISYSVYRVDEIAEDSRAQIGTHLILADQLAGDVFEKAKVTSFSKISSLTADDLGHIVCHHPLYEQGYDYDVPVYPADFVTNDTGTGFVHIAPSHGADDFYLGQKYGLPVPDHVDDAGVFRDHVPLFAGKAVFTDKGEMGDANFAVIKALDDVHALISKGTLRHEYPHSWRSRAPLIFRTTPQWFISMENNNLRAKALEGIRSATWHPRAGETRISSMIEHRPDWCISRQRVWGVPIALFIHKQTGEILKDQAVFNRIIDLFKKEGGDAWFTHPDRDFLGDGYNPDDFEKIMDTADVWLDSGATHMFVLDEREELRFPADLYLEGSDQHRGWFHTSLLVSCGLKGVAPYKNVLTHGYVLDEKGYKMSKSLGNGISMEEALGEFGADIVRLWTITSDYSEDIRIGKVILNGTSDMYRRIRNTFRFILGAIDGITEDEMLRDDELSKAPELERLVLHWISTLDAEIRKSITSYDYNKLMQRLHHFCASDLSAFYFDIRKDRLYCDRPDSFERRATRTVMVKLLEHLCAWFAPSLSFTTEEAWGLRPSFIAPDKDSVHMTTFPVVPASWSQPDLAHKWETIRDIRRVITGALEPKRTDKTIGSSLEAHPHIYLTPETADIAKSVDWAEVGITSQATVYTTPAPEEAFTLPDVPGTAVVFTLAQGKKCERCWKVLPTVGSDPEYPDLSPRDADAVRYYKSVAKEKAA